MRGRSLPASHERRRFSFSVEAELRFGREAREDSSEPQEHYGSSVLLLDPVCQCLAQKNIMDLNVNLNTNLNVQCLMSECGSISVAD